MNTETATNIFSFEDSVLIAEWRKPFWFVLDSVLQKQSVQRHKTSDDILLKGKHQHDTIKCKKYSYLLFLVLASFVKLVQAK